MYLLCWQLFSWFEMANCRWYRLKVGLDSLSLNSWQFRIGCCCTSAVPMEVKANARTSNFPFWNVLVHFIFCLSLYASDTLLSLLSYFHILLPQNFTQLLFFWRWNYSVLHFQLLDTFIMWSIAETCIRFIDRDVQLIQRPSLFGIWNDTKTVWISYHATSCLGL